MEFSVENPILLIFSRLWLRSFAKVTMLWTTEKFSVENEV